MANGDTKTESYLRVAAEGTRADLPSDTCCNTKTQNLILGVANRIMDVEDEVEELKNNPDVVDIVDTYADLQAYDTSTLTDKDIIRVLEDSTHSNGSTYYRWNATTNQFDYIGEAGGGGPTVVQTTGTSEADVMSQKAVSTMVFNDPTTKTQIHIGNNAVSTGTNSIAIGAKSSVVSNYSTAIGYYAQPTRNGEVNVGSGVYSAYGFNNTPYRVIGGVHDPVDNHDAATKGYVDANAGGVTFYSTVDLTSAANNVSLYSDKACTNAIQTSAFFQAIRSGKTVFLQSGGSGDYDPRTVVQIMSALITNVDTSDAYDDVGPGANYSFGGTQRRIYPANPDPTSTNGFSIS